jgi:hypothetical protein
MAQQLDGQDKALGLAFASSGSKTTAGRYTSELILKGASAIKDKLNIKDSFGFSRNDLQAEISKKVDGAFPDERASGAVKEAAYFIAAGIAQENGGSASSSDIKRAVRIAVGGDIIEHNGKKLPIPAGMDDGEFKDKLRNISPAEIMKQTGSTGDKRAKGMSEPGNIDLGKRPSVKNKDGSISTVRSINVGINGAEVLIPTVSDDGQILSDDESVQSYLKTGKHLGKFDTPENAVAYAKSLHKLQESSYLVRAGGVEMSVEEFAKSIPGQELIYAGPGRYAVIVRGRPVTNSQGRPVYIRVKP